MEPGKLFFIPHTGDPVEVLPAEYGELHWGCPHFAWMRTKIKCELIEHVNVLWRGRWSHMFVDEMGHVNGKPVQPNDRATAIYYNNMLERHKFQGIYTDLIEKPHNSWQQLYHHFGHFITGNALLWTGGME